MKTIVAVTLFVFLSSSLLAQQGEVLLVYSMKGDVRVVENNAEKPVKIGKVLKPGSMIKTKKAAKLTMVCRQGKPISVTREGVFPIDKWKDSCETSTNSVTTKYFQYIWDQLYVRSDEYKKEHPQSETILTDAPVRGQEELEIILNPYLDTIYYSNGEFPVAWTTTKPYNGKYYYSLVNSKTKKRVYADSSLQAFTRLDKLKKYMRQGNSYSLDISLNHDKPGEEVIIKYITAAQLSSQVSKLKNMVKIEEDMALQYFRLAYLLKESRYAADAFNYLKKASMLESAPGFYHEKLEEFKKDFELQ